MRRWFLSYSSPDEAIAARLKAAIERKDPDAHVFFAPMSLRVGGYWQPALAEAIDEADAFVLLVRKKVGPWQAMEYYAAHDKHVKSPDFPVVLMLLAGRPAPGLPFLRQLNRIVTADPASENAIARLLDAVAAGPRQIGELWRFTSPYRGLAAMEERDSDYFFGREGETVEVLKALAATPERLPILLGNSGVGKSSLAQAGVLAALRRQARPERAISAGAWPLGFKNSRGWCFLMMNPGAEPVRALVEPFLQAWQFDPTDPRRETRRAEWIDSLHNGRNTVSGLLDATERRLQERGQSTVCADAPASSSEQLLSRDCAMCRPSRSQTLASRQIAEFDELVNYPHTAFDDSDAPRCPCDIRYSRCYIAWEACPRAGCYAPGAQPFRRLTCPTRLR